MNFENARNQLAMTEQRLRTRVGYTSRIRRRPVPVQAVLALDILRREDFLVDFRPESEEMKRLGHKSIWTYLAYRRPFSDSLIPIEMPNETQRFEGIKKRSQVVNRAFLALRKHAFLDWRLPLLMVPRMADRKAIEVITLDKEFPVEGTKTARDLFRECTSRRVKGFNRATLDMVEAVNGVEVMREVGMEISKYVDDFYANGLRQPMLSFHGERDT